MWIPGHCIHPSLPSVPLLTEGRWERALPDAHMLLPLTLLTKEGQCGPLLTTPSLHYQSLPLLTEVSREKGSP